MPNSQRRRGGVKRQLTLGVRLAPEDNGAVLVLLGSQDIVKVEGEAVQVSNVERAKVVVEGIVQQRIVDGEVAGRLLLRLAGPFAGGRASAGNGRGRVAVGEKGERIGLLVVGSKIEAVCNGTLSVSMVGLLDLVVKSTSFEHGSRVPVPAAQYVQKKTSFLVQAAQD